MMSEERDGHGPTGDVLTSLVGLPYEDPKTVLLKLEDAGTSRFFTPREAKEEQPEDAEAVRIPRRLLTQLPGLLRTRAGHLRTLSGDMANDGRERDAEEARADADAMDWLRDQVNERTRARANREGEA